MAIPAAALARATDAVTTAGRRRGGSIAANPTMVAVWIRSTAISTSPRGAHHSGNADDSGDAGDSGDLWVAMGHPLLGAARHSLVVKDASGAEVSPLLSVGRFPEVDHIVFRAQVAVLL